MALTTSSAPSHTAIAAAFDARASLRIHSDLRLTPEQFVLVCGENPEAVIELDVEGRLIPMASTCSEPGARNSLLEMCLLLRPINREVGRFAAA